VKFVYDVIWRKPGSRGLDGGVDSLVRTGLHHKFPVFREFNRENRVFEPRVRPGETKLAHTSVGCGVIPYEVKREFFELNRENEFEKREFSLD
jgi:hypothetical protein